jgi:hypothetical protein
VIRHSRLVTSLLVQPGAGYVVADPAYHPTGTPIPQCTAVVVVCHPSEEREWRDRLAVAQEHVA